MIRTFTVSPSDPATTAFVVANGPSLRGVDLHELPAGVATFGMNAAYRHWERISWWPSHYACLDEVVGLHHAGEIRSLVARHGSDAPSAFLLRQNLIDQLDLHGERHVASFDRAAEASPAFRRQPVTTGSHALIWAVSLGYSRIYLLGADCNYVEVVEGARQVSGHVLEIADDAHNPNYFFDDYQRVGDRFHLPNIGGPTHFMSWHAAACAAAEAGAHVYNLSPVSRSDAFDFANLDDVLAGGSIPVIAREVRHVRGHATDTVVPTAGCAGQ